MEIKLVARDLIDTWAGELHINGGIVEIRIDEYSGDFYEPPSVEIVYISGTEYLMDSDGIEDLEEEILRKIECNDYDIPSEVSERLNSYLEWERNL